MGNTPFEAFIEPMVPLVATLGSGRAVKVNLSVELQEVTPANTITASIKYFMLMSI
jgi:hypothetical protein